MSSFQGLGLGRGCDFRELLNGEGRVLRPGCGAVHKNL